MKKRKPQMNGSQVNMPQSNDEERFDRSGFSHELTLLNKMAERERGRAKGWLRPNTLLIILLAIR